MNIYSTSSAVLQSAAKLIVLLFFAAHVEAQNTADPIVGKWRWKVNNAVVNTVTIAADQTCVTDKGGRATWKLISNEPDGGRKYDVVWGQGHFVDTLILGPLGKKLHGTNQQGARIAGERVEDPPSLAGAQATLGSLEELLSAGDVNRPFKPYDAVDRKAVDAFSKSLAVHVGKEIEFQFQPTRPVHRSSETRFAWSLLPVKAGIHTFDTHLTVGVPAELVKTALGINPGTTAKIKGTVASCSVNYVTTPNFFVSIKASSISTGGGSGGDSTGAGAASAAGLQLAKGWDTPMQGGTGTMDDLSKLFGAVAKPNVDLGEAKGTTLFEGITYLMPARQAIESLKLSMRLPSKVLIACPGFPRNSLFYYAIDGRFEGHYNRMYLVVDRADQVVSVELVDETPQMPSYYSSTDLGWHTYDFVNARSKALSTLRIQHKLALLTMTTFEEERSSSSFAPTINASNAGWRLARLDSLLVQKDNKPYSATTAKQDTRWYAPRQLVDLILTCIKKAGR